MTMSTCAQDMMAAMVQTIKLAHVVNSLLHCVKLVFLSHSGWEMISMITLEPGL